MIIKKIREMFKLSGGVSPVDFDVEQPLEEEIYDLKKDSERRNWERNLRYYDGHGRVQLALARMERASAQKSIDFYDGNLDVSLSATERANMHDSKSEAVKALKRSQKFISRHYNQGQLVEGRSDVEVKHNRNLGNLYLRKAQKLRSEVEGLVAQVNGLESTADEHYMLAGSSATHSMVPLRVTRESPSMARDQIPSLDSIYEIHDKGLNKMSYLGDGYMREIEILPIISKYEGIIIPENFSPEIPRGRKYNLEEITNN